VARFYDEGGLDTARVSAAAEDTERRAADRRRARTGVAAVVADAYGGVEALAEQPLRRELAAREFRELLDMLDLDATKGHGPGRCVREGCGRPRSMQAASSGGSGGRKWMRLGFCSAGCWAAS
jgi:hypothetical protein